MDFPVFRVTSFALARSQSSSGMRVVCVINCNDVRQCCHAQWSAAEARSR